MRFMLDDGTYAHLTAIVQTTNYRRAYLKQPLDAVEEIKQIARRHLPPECWRSAPLVMLVAERATLAKRMRDQALPAVMCVGEFVSYRASEDGSKKAVFLNIVWLQDELLPHLSTENEAALKTIKWDSVVA